MDPITLGILASIVTILAFLYMVIFGQRGLVDWWERWRQAVQSVPGGEAILSVPPHQEDMQSRPTPEPGVPVSATSSLSVKASAAMPSSPLLSAMTNGVLPSAAEPGPIDAAAQEFIKNIAQEIEARSCVFFLGAGVSIEAGMPGGPELAAMLARKAGWKYQDEPLQQIAQRYATLVGPVKPLLRDYLVRRLEDPTVGPTDGHRALAGMAENLDNILTTNWDSLLEDAFRVAKIRRCQRLYRDAHVPTLQSAMTSIVKLHGHIDDPNSYVVTQEDCQAFRERSPRLADYLRLCLITSTLVIVGYDQSDEDFQEIYGDALKSRKPGEEQRLVYVVNPREDIGWEQYWRDKAKARFIRMTAAEFLMAVYREVGAFANRDEELEVGRDLIPCPHGKPVIEFCGLPGIGKSTLLAAIRKEYQKKLDIYTASIDFEAPDLCEDSKAAHRLIWDEVTHQLGIRARYGNEEELKEQLQKKRWVVLFFDTVDQAPAGTVRWLGNTFVALMDELPDLRAVFACRSPRLSGELRFWLKQKVKTERLTPFKRLADTRRQMELEFFYDEALAELISDLTMDHPGMVQLAIDWLRSKKIKSRNDLDHAAQAELGRFIDNLLDTYILKDVDEDLKPVIRQLAYRREFAWTEIRDILHLPLPECDAFMRERLWCTGLIERDPKRHLYMVDRIARELFLNVALIQDTGRFIATSAEIGNQYDAQAAKLTENWHFFVVERLYHLVNELRGRQQADQTVDVTAVLLSELDQQLQRMTDVEGILHLREALKDDDELEALVERTHSGLYPTLLQAIAERKALSEVMKS